MWGVRDLRAVVFEHLGPLADARLRVQQQQLINDTGVDGVSYLDRALEFIIESMDLAHAECPAKSQE